MVRLYSYSISGMPAHVERPATSALPGPYRHLSAPSTPQHHQVPRSPRGRYRPQEEQFHSTPTIPIRHSIPTPQQAASRLDVDQTKTTGPFFVVFNGQEPGVFTSWYVSSLLVLLIVFLSISRPFVLRTCKWKNGDWKRYETRSTALQAYEDAYIHGGLRLSDRF